jgi:hypothetical protein
MVRGPAAELDVELDAWRSRLRHRDPPPLRGAVGRAVALALGVPDGRADDLGALAELVHAGAREAARDLAATFGEAVAACVEGAVGAPVAPRPHGRAPFVEHFAVAADRDVAMALAVRLPVLASDGATDDVGRRLLRFARHTAVAVDLVEHVARGRAAALPFGASAVHEQDGPLWVAGELLRDGASALAADGARWAAVTDLPVDHARRLLTACRVDAAAFEAGRSSSILGGAVRRSA